MDQYANYTLRDFIQDEHFIHWVKYPDADNTGFWESVRTNYPHQSVLMDQAVNLVNAFSTFYPEVPDADIEKTRQAILDQYPRGRTFPISRQRLYLSVAASVMLLLGFAFWFKSGDISIPFAKKPLTGSKTEILAQNDGVTTKVITLPDSSTITLSPHSSVTYEMTGSDRRVVHLEGEAFFSVTKNAQKPFFVFANGLITKVLGTRFKVSAYPNGEEVKVEVTSGRVRVYSTETGKDDPESRGVTLTPNQQAVYRKKDLQLTRMVVEKPKVLVTIEQLKTYIYTDTPISKIFEGLEDIYGIKVVYDKEKFKNCRLNMSLSDESLFEKLELIGKVVEARYNIIDGEVIFIGDGCSE
jgi:transmembrane sensor